MGEASHFENIQEKRDDAKFCDHEMAPDLKALLIAPAEPRSFPHRSAPPLKLKSRAKKSKRRSTSSAQRYGAAAKAKKIAPAERRAIASARAYNRMLHSLAARQARYLGSNAIYELNCRTAERREIGLIHQENAHLNSVVQEQARLIKADLGRRSTRSGKDA
jgi:hypothetical protein